MTQSSSSRDARRSGARGALSSLAWWLTVAALVLPPLLVMPGLKEPFRLPKLVASETLVLAALFALVGALGLARMVAPRAVVSESDRSRWRLLTAGGAGGVLLAVLPLVLLATATRLSTTHPEAVSEALWSLWIGAAALVAWALGLERFRGLFQWMLVPALLLAGLALYQYLGLVTSGTDAPSRAFRVQMTSRAGSVGDLAAFLVLPCLVAQMSLAGGWLARRRKGTGSQKSSGSQKGTWREKALLVLALVTLVLSLIVLLLSQTLAAIVALAASSLLFWWLLIADRRVRFALAGLALVASIVVAVASPLADRLERAAGQAGEGELNALLSGRLDGWWTGLWMLRENPLTGVGHGAYGASFGATKLAMHEAGTKFYRRHLFPTFGNAHNEFIEVGAELGLPGLLALAWALLWLGSRLRRRFAQADAGSSRHLEAVFALAAMVALTTLSTVYFPFRIALTAFPAVVVLAWIASEDFLERAPAVGVQT